jgi:hypothetical protein
VVFHACPVSAASCPFSDLPSIVSISHLLPSFAVSDDGVPLVPVPASRWADYSTESLDDGAGAAGPSGLPSRGAALRAAVPSADFVVSEAFDVHVQLSDKADKALLVRDELLDYFEWFGDVTRVHIPLQFRGRPFAIVSFGDESAFNEALEDVEGPFSIRVGLFRKVPHPIREPPPILPCFRWAKSGKCKAGKKCTYGHVK